MPQLPTLSHVEIPTFEPGCNETDRCQLKGISLSDSSARRSDITSYVAAALLTLANNPDKWQHRRASQYQMPLRLRGGILHKCL
jgi:hypothetical protein